MGELSGKLQIPRKDPTANSAAAGFMQDDLRDSGGLNSATGLTSIAELGLMGAVGGAAIGMCKDRLVGTGLMLAPNKDCGRPLPKCDKRQHTRNYASRRLRGSHSNPWPARLP